MKRGAVCDILEVSLESGQESHVVLRFHEELAKVLTQVLEGVVDPAVYFHEALDAGSFQLLVESAQSGVPLPPIINLR